jgi:hypothetical protein
LSGDRAGPDAILRVEHSRGRPFFGGRPQFKERFDMVSFDRDPDGSLRKPYGGP